MAGLIEALQKQADETTQRLVEEIKREFAKLCATRIHDPYSLAADYPQAWSEIQRQTREVSRCSGGAVFVFLNASIYGAYLAATFATDLDNTPDNMVTFRAPIAAVN